MKWGEQKYQSRALYFGKFIVANAERSLIHDGGFYANCFLPGIKKYLGTYPTTELAEMRVEMAVKHWLKNSGLQENPK